MILALLLFAAQAARPAHWRADPPETARAPLGFSGATLAIRSLDDPRRPGTARRHLTLIMPNGATRTLPLQDGGGRVGNNDLILYHVDLNDFLLISQRDCVAIDPIQAGLHQCVRASACARQRTFVGVFSWMNGFDPPHGAFTNRFRFLPVYDVIRNRDC